MNAPARIANFVLFQAGWFVCVWAGARGLDAVALAAVAAVGGLTLWRFSANPRSDALLVAVVAVIGWCVDSAHLALGSFSLREAGRIAWLCPPWLVALWALFATTLRCSLGWLAGRYALAALLGAVAGPLSYMAGARMGAVDLNPNRLFSLAALAVGWAAVMPLLVRLARVPGKSTVAAEGTP